MGTRFVNMSIQVPVSLAHLTNSVLFVSYIYEIVSSASLLFYIMPNTPHKEDTITWKNNTKKTLLLASLSKLENFGFAWALFYISFVSCPEKITAPWIYSVFLRLHPLRIMLSAPREMSFCNLCNL